MPTLVSIDVNAFNNDFLIDARVSVANATAHGALRTALCYLYKDDGPINLPRARLLAAEEYLEPAEQIVIRWLYTRTNGRLRSTYGADALRAARSSRYRCEVCGFADVRVLNIDHVNGRVAGTPFACLCANCHTIKSRENDWSGEKASTAKADEGESALTDTGGATVVGDISAESVQLCPICRTEVATSERYPRSVCMTCATKASSVDGRLLSFSNGGLSGGFVARFADTGADYPSNECYIDGMKCYADEAHFGGIIIEAC